MRTLFRLTLLASVLLLPMTFAVCGSGEQFEPGTHYLDTDGDGYGNVNFPQHLDAPLDGWVMDSTDCDDSDPDMNPGEDEICDDWFDNNCDDLVDCYNTSDCMSAPECSACADSDGDGYLAVDYLCSGGNDCADADSTLNPGVDADGDSIHACQDCDDANSLTGTGTAEVCNDFDDDCDYFIDEDFGVGGTVSYTDLDGTPGLVLADDCGVGACAGGTVVCAGDEISLECSTEGNAGGELCNGTDDDCNGSIDEEYTAGGSVSYTDWDGSKLFKSDACGTGACSGGEVVCGADEMSLDCDTSSNGGPETCDGTDEDCDGVIDNGDPGGGAGCDGTDSDLCEEGSISCVSGTLTCNDFTSSTFDICNGVDDDCDAASDDGDEDPLLGNSCNTGKPGVCDEGTNICSGGMIVCEQNTAPSSETCDGADNDCNGAPDDGDICSGYSCGTFGCLTSCTIPADCYSGYTCSGGSCI